MDHTMKYVGSHKIHAIKAVREIFDLGLKEAKDVVEGDHVRISTLQKFAILGVYLGDAYENNRDFYPSDWFFTPIAPVAHLESLIDNQPMNRG